MATSVMRQTNSEGTYTFSSQPRAVTQRKKYRPTQDDDGRILYGNIMHDKRVIRGNTYSQHVLPTTASVDPVELQKQQLLEARKRRDQAARHKRQQLQQQRQLSPGPVEGRRHVDIQTEIYLEELSDRVEEIEQGSQTDDFLDRPPSPMYIPARTGVDCGTQIEPGELFDFHVEVAPLLEVLVGKTMEQALLEVMEEEELDSMREQQRMFEELRNAEMSECQRLEEQDRRHRQEKERRMKEQSELVRQQKETAEKISAHAFAQRYMADLVPAVFNNLQRNGYFYDTVERDLEADFLPWLGDEVEERLNTQAAARRIVDNIIREVIVMRKREFSNLQEKELEAERERLEKEKEEDEVDIEKLGPNIIIANLAESADYEDEAGDKEKEQQQDQQEEQENQERGQDGGADEIDDDNKDDETGRQSVRSGTGADPGILFGKGHDPHDPPLGSESPA